VPKRLDEASRSADHLTVARASSRSRETQRIGRIGVSELGKAAS